MLSECRRRFGFVRDAIHLCSQRCHPADGKRTVLASKRGGCLGVTLAFMGVVSSLKGKAFFWSVGLSPRPPAEPLGRARGLSRRRRRGYCGRDFEIVRTARRARRRRTPADKCPEPSPLCAFDLLDSLFFRPSQPVKDGASRRRVAAEVLDRLRRSEVLHPRGRRRGSSRRRSARGNPDSASRRARRRRLALSAPMGP